MYGTSAITRSAKLTFSGLNVEYRSPSNGLVRFGWEGAFRVDNVEVPLHDYPRYDNPYVRAEFGALTYKVECQGRELVLDFEEGTRDIRQEQ